MNYVDTRTPPPQDEIGGRRPAPTPKYFQCYKSLRDKSGLLNAHALFKMQKWKDLSL